MSLAPVGVARAEVVARLRAAGCVFAEEEARLLLSEASTTEDLAVLVDQRLTGLPLEVVLGWAHFAGQRIALEPGVFVPRRRTELLVREAIATAGPGAVVVDLCCGSGAVGVALLAGLGQIELYAVDVDPVAVRCARRNLADRGRVYQGDLYEPLPSTLRGQVDVVVANAPYVPTDAVVQMPPEARDHEPQVALDGGTDGLEVLRRVAAGAPEWLAPGGSLLVETSRGQAPDMASALVASGLMPRIVCDERLAATMVIGRQASAGT